MVIPFTSGATKQTARKAPVPKGFDDNGPSASPRSLRVVHASAQSRGPACGDATAETFGKPAPNGVLHPTAGSHPRAMRVDAAPPCVGALLMLRCASSSQPILVETRSAKDLIRGSLGSS